MVGWKQGRLRIRKARLHVLEKELCPLYHAHTVFGFLSVFIAVPEINQVGQEKQTSIAIQLLQRRGRFNEIRLYSA